MNDFFAPTSVKRRKMAEASLKWSEEGPHKSVLVAKFKYTSPDLTSTKDIAAFDLDQTLIDTKTGYPHPRDENDWKWLRKDILTILQALNKDKTIVIFTNQAGLGRSDKKKNEWKLKVERILNTLDIPILLFAATKKDAFRKPRLGMWELLNKELRINSIFYVGDAAGRGYDHSAMDVKFALNAKIEFYTPEEYFDGQARKDWTKQSFPFNPIDLLHQKNDAVEWDEMNGILLIVGSPASGKSTFCSNYLPGWTRINQDTLKSLPKCVSAAKEALEKDERVVVDNTNPTIETRSKWIDLARAYSVLIRCVYIQESFELAMHNNLYRHYYEKTRDLLPYIAFSSYFTRLESPTIDEGFEDMFTRKFEFVGTENDREQWKLYWIDD